MLCEFYSLIVKNEYRFYKIVKKGTWVEVDEVYIKGGKKTNIATGIKKYYMFLKRINKKYKKIFWENVNNTNM